MSSLHSKVSSTKHPPAFPSFLKHTTELLSPQAPASPSSLPSLPPTRPLPFRAPLCPVRSLNELPVPLPPSLSSSFPTFPTLLPSAPSSYTFLPSLQGLPAPTPNTASPRRPPSTPRRTPSHTLHSPVPVQTWPWLSSPLLRFPFILLSRIAFFCIYFCFFEGKSKINAKKSKPRKQNKCKNNGQAHFFPHVFSLFDVPFPPLFFLFI